MTEEERKLLELESKRFAGNVGSDKGGDAFGGFAHPIPTYTIELIVAELKRIGKWEGFKDYMWNYGELGERGGISGVFDILTTPLYFMQAASAYIEEEREDAAYQTQQVMEDR